MMTYSDAANFSKTWYENLTIGQRWSIETDGILAIFAARSVMLNEPPATHCSWHGFYGDDVKPEQLLKTVHDTVPGLKTVLRFIDFDEKKLDEGWDFWFFHETGGIHVTMNDRTGDVEYVGNSLEIVNKLNVALAPLLVNNPPTGSVYMMTATGQGPEFHSVGVGGFPLERLNYSPDVLAAFDRIKSELRVSNPRGRLTVLNGPAGTGKTYLIRGLLQEVTNTVFVVVPPHFVASLAEPASLTALSKLRQNHPDEPIVIVIEDADACLARREEGDLSAISAVLNIGDGLMGSVMDIRIVATTNAQHQDFDPAIRRPGRLSSSITVGQLSSTQANAIYRRLTQKDEDVAKPLESMMLAEVYQRAFDAGWKPMDKPKKALGFGN